MRIVVEGLRYATLQQDFVKQLTPYEHQLKTLKYIRQAIAEGSTICIENASITGSGKTLANFSAAILDGTPTCGIYPTNELMLDQMISLSSFFGDEDIALLDSQGLDDILVGQRHMRSHAHALAWVTGDIIPIAVLTNPDVLYLAMYALYGQMFSTYGRAYGLRVFTHMLANYPVVAFDEFHLYNQKQIANVAYIIGTAKELAPEKPHIFLFSSATPQPAFKNYLQRLGLTSIDVTNTAASVKSMTATQKTRVVCEPLTITLLPADLLHWKGGEAIYNALDEILTWADQSTREGAKGVFIVDSVYEAKNLALELRHRYGNDAIGEVHGYMNDQERAPALLRRFSVGSTTIDVGVDLTDQKSKDFLVCEARSASQAIQRLGRLGRRGREEADIAIPNHAWLVVPEYVYHYIQHNAMDGACITRAALNELLKSAYLGHEDFAAYTKKYSVLEAVAASERASKLYLDDIKQENVEKLHRLVPTLYDSPIPENQQQAEERYARLHKRQLAIWRKFGREVQQGKGQTSRTKRYYLSDLESFRGGMESDFTVALYDDLDRELGFKPLKTYNLPFVLRRTVSEELSKARFEQLIKQHHPHEAETWLAEMNRQRHLTGYLHVHELVRGKANDVYFEISRLQLEEVLRFNTSSHSMMIRLDGFTIDGTNAHLLKGEGSIRETLRKQPFNCWVTQYNSFYLAEHLRLPPLFTIYPLHVKGMGGNIMEQSVAFGLDAFFLDSLPIRHARSSARSDTTAIFL